MGRIAIKLLGPFEVFLDGEPVTSFESDKVRALLAYLASEVGQSHRRELLAGLVRRAPTGQPEALAAAWLALADWNQWNDRRTEALAGYQTVARVLRESGREQLLREWLGQPVELPANGAFRQSRQAGIVAPVVVQARFDVTARGRARNIEVTALDSEYQGKAGRVRRELKQVRFRPRFVDGEPEAQSQLMREYEVFN